MELSVKFLAKNALTLKNKSPAMNILQGIYLSVVLPGLEPRLSEPKSDVLPLHHRTIFK